MCRGRCDSYCTVRRGGASSPVINVEKDTTLEDSGVSTSNTPPSNNKINFQLKNGTGTPNSANPFDLIDNPEQAEFRPRNAS